MSKMTLRLRMLAHRSRALVYLAAGLACTPGFAWAQADTLKHDPFARPVFLKATPPPAAQTRDGAGAGKPALPEPAWQPELAAVIVAGPKSMVSIDGTIVGIGEVINGHRLVAVHEQEAIFVRNGKRVTLTLRGIQPAPEAPARKDARDTTARSDAPPKMMLPVAPTKQDAPPQPDDRQTAERRGERKLEEK